MSEGRFDLIGIDGDDTLWHNERDYVEARERFARMVAHCGVAVAQEDLTEEVNRTELRNIQDLRLWRQQLRAVAHRDRHPTDGRARGRP